MPKRYPEHFKEPTDGVLEQYVTGRKAGLVDAGHPALRTPSETVAVEDIRSKEVRRILRRMHEVKRERNASGYTLVGIDASQIGENIRCALVPHPTRKDRLLTVFNAEIVNQSEELGELVPHGCHSSNETFTKLRVPKSHTLRGYDWKGEPLGKDGQGIHRTGFKAVVDVHEILMHENGKRPPDVGIEQGIQIDHRPPEMKQAYRDFFDGDPTIPNDPNAFKNNPDTLPDWPSVYPPDQWAAVVAGEFALRDFVNQ